MHFVYIRVQYIYVIYVYYKTQSMMSILDGRLQICNKRFLYIFAKFSMDFTFDTCHNIFASINVYVPNLLL